MKSWRMAGLALLVSMATAGTASAQSATVTFAWNPSPDTIQYTQALSGGLWKEQNLEVKVIGFPSGREAFEALLGGQVDFAAMAEFPAVTGALRKQKFAVIADTSRFKSNRLIATSKKVDLKSLQDLQGRKVGTTLGTNVDFALDLVLSRAGVKAEIINAGPTDQVPALLRGDIDAAYMFPTFYANAKKVLADNYRELMTPEYNLHFIICASGDILEKRPELVRQFLAGLVKADAQVAKDPTEAQDATVKSMKGMIDMDGMKIMSQDYDYGLKLDTSLLDLMVEEGAWILKRGLIKGEATPATYRAYIYDAALKSIAPDRVKLP